MERLTVSFKDNTTDKDNGHLIINISPVQMNFNVDQVFTSWCNL